MHARITAVLLAKEVVHGPKKFIFVWTVLAPLLVSFLISVIFLNSFCFFGLMVAKDWIWVLVHMSEGSRLILSAICSRHFFKALTRSATLAPTRRPVFLV